MEVSIIQKENPLKIFHLKIIRILLMSVGAWSGEILDAKMAFMVRFFRTQVLIQTSITIIGEVIFFAKNYKQLDFFVLGDIYITAFLTWLTLYRCILTYLKNYGIVSKHFFFSFHLIHFKHKGHYFMEMYNTIHKVSHYFTLFTVIISTGGMILFNSPPLYKNYKNGAFTDNRDINSTRLEFAIYYIFPGFNPEDHFLFTTIFNFFLAYCCTVLVCMNDLFLILIVFQIIGHILVLSHNLKSMPRPKKQLNIEGESENNGLIQFPHMFDDEENKNIHNEIAGFVEHHKLIVSFTDQISNCFGFMLALNYTYHLVSCCLLLLECSQGDVDAIARFGPLTIIIFGQLIQISVIFEIVNTVSVKLKDSVYEMPWECMSISNQHSVCFLLSRVQIPINVTAMSMTTVGVQTMAGILKTTFSYFAFLRSMNN